MVAAAVVGAAAGRGNLTAALGLACARGESAPRVGLVAEVLIAPAGAVVVGTRVRAGAGMGETAAVDAELTGNGVAATGEAVSGVATLPVTVGVVAGATHESAAGGLVGDVGLLAAGVSTVREIGMIAAGEAGRPCWRISTFHGIVRLAASKLETSTPTDAGAAVDRGGANDVAGAAEEVDAAEEANATGDVGDELVDVPASAIFEEVIHEGTADAAGEPRAAPGTGAAEGGCGWRAKITHGRVCVASRPGSSGNGSGSRSESKSWATEPIAIAADEAPATDLAAASRVAELAAADRERT